MESRSLSGESTRFRTSSETRAELEDIVGVEGGSLTEILVEGVWRVVGSRHASMQMQPGYLHPTRANRREALNFRISTEEEEALKPILDSETCSVSRLLAEGIWRVAQNRRHDVLYQAGRERILRLQAEIELVRASLLGWSSDKN